MESCWPTSFAPSLDDSLRQIDEVATAVGVTSYIVPEDTTALRKYFSTQGMSALQKSTAGLQLDRAQLYSNPTIPCVACGGNIEKHTGGFGWVSSGKKWAMPSDDEEALLRWTESEIRALPPPADTTCKDCQGWGWVLSRRPRNWRNIRMFWVSSRYVNGVRGPLKWTGPFTIAEAETEFYKFSEYRQDVCIAKSSPDDDDPEDHISAIPTGSSVKRAAGGVSVSDSGMQRIAVVGRRLDQMARMWALSVDILDAYYGPEDGGQVTSVWPLTAAGKTLLRANKHQLAPMLFYQNERNDYADKRKMALSQQDSEREDRRARLFLEADEQAKALLQAARQLWNIVVMEERKAAGYGTHAAP